VPCIQPHWKIKKLSTLSSSQVKSFLETFLSRKGMCFWKLTLLESVVPESDTFRLWSSESDAYRTRASDLGDVFEVQF
jgi:hypothetical protein